jgi:leukotriene-A4 hydrolase
MTVPLLLLTLAAAAPATDVHSLGNPAEVRTTHLSLDLRLRFEDKTIAGTTGLTLSYPKGPADHLDLDTRDLKIKKVTALPSGRDLPFTLQPPVPHLGQRLRITLPRPAPRRVRVEYETSPQASALQWLEPRQTTSGKLPFLFTQSQAIHARSWIPCQDSPGVRVTYDAVVRAPAGMTVVMSAAHLAHRKDEGVFRFRLQRPIPPYLIALAAGEIAFKALSSRTGVYAEPAVLEKAAWEFADVEKMVQVTERLYGPYRWGRWDTIVLPPSFPYGGMENPRLTFATPTVIAGDRSLVAVLAHELAHSWSGNLVTNATWSDFWLNEGFTSYIENRIVEALYGKDVSEMQALLAQRELKEAVADPKTRPEDTHLHIALEGRDPDEGMAPVAYDKGANLLRMLEHRFGRARFDAFLRRYFDAHAFRSITTAQFLEALKRDLFRGDDALWKEVAVEDWVYRPGIPATMVVPASDRFQKTRAASQAFAQTGSLEGVKREWVTAEWLDFLNSLPREMKAEQLAELDRRFAFSRSGNSEVLFAWLMHVVRNTWEPGFSALEDFLTRMGRRKFLRPLYQAMQDNPSTRDLARKIYAKARPTYHPIAVAAVDAVLK